MDINRKKTIEEKRRKLNELAVWLEGRGELETALAIKEVSTIIDTLVEEINFLERELVRLGDEVYGKL